MEIFSVVHLLILRVLWFKQPILLVWNSVDAKRVINIHAERTWVCHYPVLYDVRWSDSVSVECTVCIIAAAHAAVCIVGWWPLCMCCLIYIALCLGEISQWPFLPRTCNNAPVRFHFYPVCMSIRSRPALMTSSTVWYYDACRCLQSTVVAVDYRTAALCYQEWPCIDVHLPVQPATYIH